MSGNPFDDDPGSSEPLDDAVLQDVDAIMAARSLDDLMKTEDAEALRSILAALHEFPELDGFIANFCAEFRTGLRRLSSRSAGCTCTRTL